MQIGHDSGGCPFENSVVVLVVVRTEVLLGKEEGHGGLVDVMA